MAPITTFIKISPNTTIPLRIFINRKSIIQQQQQQYFETAISSAQTVNHRALVRLRSTTRLILSNRQIRSLVASLQAELCMILFETSPESLIMKNEGDGKERLKFKVDVDGWELYVNLVMGDVMEVRNMMKFGEVDKKEYNGMELLIRKPREVKQREEQEEVSLLQEGEDEEMRIPEEGEVVRIPDEEDSTEDKKTQLKYDYKGTNILLKRGINIEVLKIPKY
ncbi:hypothetical protein WICANDRAFT_62229 [Wickerhamomyces anomalus NRRL Y-366-8]|uniref:Uncharacterized protein n=1 Tax=Wickerhamomyces anomalus (strain ATCC 58044 / CBS 1984 / NCYC 433 / NRRL Y-366-8) TaxID=683960 RepID=A0A1E3P2S2_WICAA|nr:uncharacterized protein WICANDRAFT_62229 [Wickerhamomyces anomalus NRRL Y-366-8]ODQ59643.1 hypothetical protein WICANDRAFT_62229 [Wickerhamomyces anomalus NRRL Y-366-8]